jgi:hypothetical protein
MAYAINIRSDNNSSKPIRALWKTCGALEHSPSMEALQYAPHITFAVYDDIDLSRLFGVFDSAVLGLGSVTVRFEKLGYFEALNGIILWAAPTLPERLWSVYDHIHSEIDVDLCRPNYRPGTWVPHCSLALSVGLEKKQQALAIVGQSIEPIEVVFDTADCASFLPVKVLHEKLLGRA